MPDLVIFGANQGAEISDCKKEDMFLELFYDGSTGTKFKKISRTNGDVHYVFLKYADEKKHFISYSGRSGCFFGMSLILSKDEQTKYNPDTNTVCKLMCKMYNDHVKDSIIQHFPNGNLKYIIPTLAPKDDSVAKNLVKKLQAPSGEAVPIATLPVFAWLIKSSTISRVSVFIDFPFGVDFILFFLFLFRLLLSLPLHSHHTQTASQKML